MHSGNTELLFPPKETPNRRMTPWELQEERELSNIFQRPMRYFIKDPPFYPWLPPEPYVNFDLRFKDK